MASFELVAGDDAACGETVRPAGGEIKQGSTRAWIERGDSPCACADDKRHSVRLLEGKPDAGIERYSRR